MSEELLWGIDLGGTKMEGVVFRKDEPTTPLTRQRIPTEANGGYEHICKRVKILVQQLQDEVGQAPKMLGIGIPGTIDGYSGKVKNANTTCLVGHTFKADLEEQLRIPVKMANDANCFALAETRIGVVATLDKQPQSVFGIIMGTGVGSGLVINGKVLNGRHGIAGEWGHNVLIPNGTSCYCGKKGCVETVISGPALERFYEEKSGQKLDLKSIISKTEEDPIAQQTLERLLKYFGKAVATILNVLDPEVVILGGGVGNIPQLATEGGAHTLAHLFNDRIDTLFLTPRLGDSAGVFGAAFLCE